MRPLRLLTAGLAAASLAACASQPARPAAGQLIPVSPSASTRPSPPAVSPAGHTATATSAATTTSATASPTPTSPQGTPPSALATTSPTARATRSPTPAPTHTTTRPTVSPTPSPTAPGAVALSIVDYAFNPQSVTVPVGSTVRATNHGHAVHTWTSSTGVWDSGNLTTGQSFSFRFTATGVFAFVCSKHASMTGSVTVS